MAARKKSSKRSSKKRKRKTYAGAPAGSGKNFASLKKALGRRKGIKNPGALAAFIGRKKYGKKGFAKLATKGKK